MAGAFNHVVLALQVEDMECFSLSSSKAPYKVLFRVVVPEVVLTGNTGWKCATFLEGQEVLLICSKVVEMTDAEIVSMAPGYGMG
jgi:hypothetical protein